LCLASGDARVSAPIWYGARVGVQGGVQVNRPVDRWNRLAVAAVLMAALGLAACGRKGPLDPPPGSSLTTPQPYTPRPSIGEESDSLAPRATDDNGPLRSAPAAPATAAAAPAATTAPPPKKTFFLDFLIGK
jgi:predicted small lipoprotein YifL